jgi:hypothetical protein
MIVDARTPDDALVLRGECSREDRKVVHAHHRLRKHRSGSRSRVSGDSVLYSSAWVVQMAQFAPWFSAVRTHVASDDRTEHAAVSAIPSRRPRVSCYAPRLAWNCDRVAAIAVSRSVAGASRVANCCRRHWQLASALQTPFDGNHEVPASTNLINSWRPDPSPSGSTFCTSARASRAAARTRAGARS